MSEYTFADLRRKGLTIYREAQEIPMTANTARVWLELASRYAERNGCDQTADYLRVLERGI